MGTLRIPMSGLMLVSHLAAYGLGAVLEDAGERAFIGHDPDSMEVEPQVETDAELERLLECVRRSAVDCKEIVDADLVPGRRSNDQQPVICARIATNIERAQTAMPLREGVLDRVEETGATIPAGLIAGLGAPAIWLSKGKPSHGASQLDGVPGNKTSDFVRGVLRNARPRVAKATVGELQGLLSVGDPPPPTDSASDKTGWAPPGTRVSCAYQWLAALGMGLLPVGLSASGFARTPCCRRGGDRGVKLPVLQAPTSMPRLRGLLQAPELIAEELTPVGAARLRALGIRELVDFPVLSSSNDKMVSFSFGRAERLEL